MDQSTGFWLIVVLAFLFVGWYLVGAQWQQHVRARYIRVLGETAQQLSESKAMPRIREIGQAGFQLTVDDAVAPFSKLAIVTLLMPRESILLLVAALVRRKGDSVVVRADLRERPRGTSSPTPTPPITQLSFSRESPNVIASFDPRWIRGHEHAQIAALVREAPAAGPV